MSDKAAPEPLYSKVSDKLASSSTKSHDFTQMGSTSFPDFNLSLRIHLTASPALQAALERIADALKPVQKDPETTTEIVFHGLTEEQANELVSKGVVSQALAEPEKMDDFEFKGVIVERPDWIKVPGIRGLRYYSDGDKVYIKCMSSSVIETTWKRISELVMLPDDKYQAARDGLLKELKRDHEKNSITAINCFVNAIMRDDVTVPDGVVIPGEQKKPATVKHGKKVSWTSILKHPSLKYREDAGDLILNYSGSIITTSWEVVERVARIDSRFWNHEIEKIIGSNPSAGKKAGVRLFLKLVEKGEIQHTTISQFQHDDGAGVSA